MRSGGAWSFPAGLPTNMPAWLNDYSSGGTFYDISGVYDPVSRITHFVGEATFLREFPGQANNCTGEIVWLNYDLFYAVSRDGGLSWSNLSGSKTTTLSRDPQLENAQSACRASASTSSIEYELVSNVG